MLPNNGKTRTTLTPKNNNHEEKNNKRKLVYILSTFYSIFENSVSLVTISSSESIIGSKLNEAVKNKILIFITYWSHNL